MNIKTTLKTSVAVAALFAVAVPVAEAGNVTNSNKNSVQVSGQISKGFMWADDGAKSNSAIVDNDNSGSRFRIVGSGKINESMTVGFNLENEIQSNESNGMSVAQTGGGQLASANGNTGFGQTTFAERVAEISFDHKQFGKVTIGQGSTASDGTSEVNLSGAGMAIYGGAPLATGVHLHVKSAVSQSNSTLKVGDFFTNLDGGSRNDRLRYDSPKFAGFGVATSYISGGGSDVALTYAGKFGGVKVQAAGSLYNPSSISTTIDKQWTMSAAALHDSGINIRGNYGKENFTAATRKNATTWNIQLGYIAKLTAMGSTNFAVGYTKTDDHNAVNDEATMWEVGVVQNISDAGTELYVGYTNHSFERTNTKFDDVAAVIAGARVKF